MIKVLELRDDDKDRWDSFVRGSPSGIFFHLSGWKDVMEKTFGIPSYYLFAEKDGQILGVLPLFHVNSRISGNFLTSTPGAICSEDSDAVSALISRAKEIVTVHGASYLFLCDSRFKWDEPDLVTSERQCTMVVELDDDPENNFRRLTKTTRQRVKKAIKSELEIKILRDSVEVFYPTFSRAMREKGTPTFGLRFFQNILDQFPDQIAILMVMRNKQILGGGFVSLFGDSEFCTWSGTLRKYNDLNTNYLLFWETLKFGITNGLAYADLGRSEWESGTFQFKKQWDANPQPLYQQFYLNGISQPPAIGSTRAEGVDYRLFTNVWNRLPLSWVEFLGPQLRRRMPFG